MAIFTGTGVIAIDPTQGLATEHVTTGTLFEDLHRTWKTLRKPRNDEEAQRFTVLKCGLKEPQPPDTHLCGWYATVRITFFNGILLLHAILLA